MSKTKDQEIETLRNQIAILSASRQAAQPVVTQAAMVGIRNISDYTIGIPAKFGDPELQLFPDLNANDPNSVAVVSFASWKALLRGPYVAKGMIIRDDTVLGPGYVVAPADRPSDYAPGTEANQVPNPVEWVESRTEAQVREDLAKMTSEPSLRRVRRAVDLKLKELQATYSDAVENKQLKSWEDLPVIYRFVEDYTTRKLERPEVEV